VFDRFNDSAQRVLANSSEECRTLGHTSLNTSHLLLALTSTKTGDGEQTTAARILQDVADLDYILELVLAPMTPGAQPTGFGHLPYGDNYRQVLQASLRAADLLGDNHIGPEHLLAGLSENAESTGGSVLASLGFTADNILARIKPAPAVSPVSPRSYPVYVATGESIDPADPVFYPLRSAVQDAHPGEDIAAFQISLSDGEFFEVRDKGRALEVHGRFTSYPDAFAAAKALRDAAFDNQILIMTPSTNELRGTDPNGHDVVLGQSVQYSASRILHRLTALPHAPEEESTHV
jgi:hypothetical protein